MEEALGEEDHELFANVEQLVFSLMEQIQWSIEVKNSLREQNTELENKMRKLKEKLERFDVLVTCQSEKLWEMKVEADRIKQRIINLTEKIRRDFGVMGEQVVTSEDEEQGDPVTLWELAWNGFCKQYTHVHEAWMKMGEALAMPVGALQEETIREQVNTVKSQVTSSSSPGKGRETTFNQGPSTLENVKAEEGDTRQWRRRHWPCGEKPKRQPRMGVRVTHEMKSPPHKQFSELEARENCSHSEKGSEYEDTRDDKTQEIISTGDDAVEDSILYSSNNDNVQVL